MFEPHSLDELAQRLCALVPAEPAPDREQLSRSFRALLQSGLHKLELVGRSEFEVQRVVLLRLRERLEVLESRLNEWEVMSSERAG